MRSHLLSVACIAMLAASTAACGRTATTPGNVPVRTVQAPQPLTVQAFLPDADAIFKVSSVLVSGVEEAVLIDAQFSDDDARRLADGIKASGKHLTTIYISHSDPDYYFGLDRLQTAFPDARIVATPQTVAHIRATHAQKLETWAPQLGENAPRRIVVPQPLHGDRLYLEGQELRIVGLDGATPDRSFVWIPSIATVAGGIPVMAGEHVWMADTQSTQSHADWLATLDSIAALRPQRVIPGHALPGAPQDLDAVRFTAGYIRAFDEEAATAGDSAELIAAMKRRYPELEGDLSLQISAKVAKGEMRWP